MILDINLPYVLNDDSIARILCDSFFDATSGISIEDQLVSISRMEENEIQERVTSHLIQYGKLGIPSNRQLSVTYKITEEEAQTFIDTLKRHLYKRR